MQKCGFSEVSLLAEEPDEKSEDLLKSLTIGVISDDYASFDDDGDTSEMPMNVQKKGWEDILRKQCIEKVNADPDEIDISSDLEDNDHIPPNTLRISNVILWLYFGNLRKLLSANVHVT